MNREMSLHNETWDFYGHRGVGTTNNFYSQHEWNQTLMTKINFIAARIHHSSLRGSGNTIRLHPNISYILESLKFYNRNENRLSGRFDVHFDDTIKNNIIFVYHNHIESIDFSLPMLLPRIVHKKHIRKSIFKKNYPTISSENTVPDIMEIEIVRSKLMTKQERTQYIRDFVGHIDIINYNG